jgi:hypothetical protein
MQAYLPLADPASRKESVGYEERQRHQGAEIWDKFKIKMGEGQIFLGNSDESGI